MVNNIYHHMLHMALDVLKQMGNPFLVFTKLDDVVSTGT